MDLGEEEGGAAAVRRQRGAPPAIDPGNEAFAGQPPQVVAHLSGGVLVVRHGQELGHQWAEVAVGETRGGEREPGVDVLRGDLFASPPQPFDCAILNPPYRKINTDSDTRRLLRVIGMETSNIYTGFLTVASHLLRPVLLTSRNGFSGRFGVPNGTVGCYFRGGLSLEEAGGTMRTTLLFPTVAGLRVDRLWRDGPTLHVEVTTTHKRACCPCCGRHSRRMHNRYTRTITDLPCGGSAVTLHVHVRRFWCRVRWCRRRIFCERLPDVVAPWAQRTVRLQDHLRREALALGGEPGARLASTEGTPVSARTLLRLVRTTPLPSVGHVRVLGVDDWSRRKGRDFGTILVDLEAHQVLDLLPDRTAATLATWLDHHPELEVVSRDRAGAYAEGIRRGAPQAVQVADRFHLLKNLTEVVERALGRHHIALRTAARTAAHAVVAAAPQVAGSVTAEGETTASPRPLTPAPPHLTREEPVRQARRERRLARYQEVLALHQQGCSQCQIASALGMGRKTVRRFLRAEGFPERSPVPARASGLRRYEPYLRERWVAGCDNALQLWRDLQAQGYPGAASTVRQFLARWRAQPGRPGKQGPHHVAGRVASPPPVRAYSPRQTAWLLLNERDTLTDDERAYVDHLRRACPAVARLQALARAFRALMHDHDLAAFARWLGQADQSEAPELHGFANGLRADRAAVEAGLTLPWSQGQTEGQVNRLKTTKRAMYGRASFDLLRIRVLCAS